MIECYYNLTTIEVRGEVMNSKDYSKIFKALSNENRLELYLQILRGSDTSFNVDGDCECFISDIIGKLNIGAPTISHHLKELSNADLIITEKRGKFLVAKINKELLNKIQELFTI